MSEEEQIAVDQPPAEEGGEPNEGKGTDEDWGDDITEDKDGGLFKKVLTPGHGSEHPLSGDDVKVHYTGRLLSGEVFDSSVDRGEHFKFKLGEGQVIKGWDKGVATMTRGEKCILTCKPEYAYGEQGSPPKIPPAATLRFEVELFDWSGEDITGDGGVLKSILHKGDGYSTPTEGAVVEAHIRGTCQGRTFEERDVTFDYGEGAEQGILSAVEQVIGKMKNHETARITVKSKYGFGEEGNVERSIPNDADLVYEVRLNNFTKSKEPWDYDSLEERLADATRIKEKGTKYFKDAKYDLARKLYKRGSELLTDTQLRKEETKEAAKPLRVAFHLNLAACHLKLKCPNEAIDECNDAIADDSTNVKGYFRRGQAHVALQDYDEAIVDFQEVLKLEPQNKAAQRELTQTRNKKKAFNEKEKRRFAKMFAGLSEKDEGQPTAKAEDKKQETEAPSASGDEKAGDSTEPMET